jgi:hypothetical protein
MPITWRNIESRGVGDAARLLEGSRDSLNAGVSQIGSVFDDRQALSEKRYGVGVENNTDAFLNELQKYRTPEELQAAQQSGAIDSLRSQFGQQIDEDAVRNAPVDRLNTLRGDEQDSAAYAAFQLDETVRPLRSQAEELIASGDTNGFDTFLTPENRELFSEAGILDDLVQSRTDRFRADRIYNRTEETESQRDSSDALISSIASGATDENRAMAQYDEWAFRQGIDGEVAAKGREQLRTQFNQINELSTLDKEDYAIVETNANLERDSKITTAETAREQVQRDNPLVERFSFTDSDKITTGDIVTLATENGWDEMEFGTPLSDVIKSSLDEVIDRYEITGNQEKDIAKIIMQRAVASLGREAHLLPWTKQELPTDALKDEFDREYAAYIDSKQAEANRIAGERSYNAIVSNAISEATTTTQNRLKELRQNKANIRSIERNRR